MGVPGIRVEQNRVKLADQIPLRTPYSVTIVPCSYCSFSCRFCPSKLIKQKWVMSLAAFKHIIDNANFPDQVKMLHLYNVGEPTMNANLANMIRYAKASTFSQRISMVTNGSMLNRYVSDELTASGIDRIIVSLYGLNDTDYYKITGRTMSLAKIYENIMYLNSIKGGCEIFVKVIDRVVKDNTFVEMFKDHCDYYSIEPILPIWPNFRPEGEMPELDGKGLYEGVPAVERLACHYPFYSMVVNARGFVNPCLADWEESVELGDTSKQGLREIWESEKYRGFRLMQLRGERLESGLCRTCGTLRVATAPEDDIDGDRERLLELFGGGR